jgi:hypothetical protein
MRLLAIMLLAAGLVGSASAQGLPGLGGGSSLPPGLSGLPGLSQPETPEQKRAFCQRVGQAAVSCGLSLSVTAMTSCLVRTLPPQDSLRVAQVAERARGSAGSLLSECGIGLR